MRPPDYLVPRKHSRGDDGRLRLARYGTPLGIALGTALTFALSLGNGWLLWDDPINVTSNVHLRLPLREFMVWSFTDVGYALRYKPLNWLVWYGTFRTTGLGPFWYHALNVVAHATSATLLFVLLRRLITHLRLLSPRRVLYVALFPTLWWALHPVRAEPVAWVSGFGYPFSTCFFLAALIVYAREGGWTGTPRLGVIIVASSLFCLSLLAYPAALTGAALFILLDVAARLLPASPRTPVVRQCLAKIPFIAAAGLVVALTVLGRLLQPDAHWPPAPGLAQLGVMERILRGVLCHHQLLLRELFPTDLQVLYADINVRSTSTAHLAAAILSVGATLSAGLLLLRHMPLAGAGLLSFSALLIPYLGWTESVHFASERYGYVAAIGIAIAIAVASAHVVQRLTSRAIRVGVLLATTGVLIQGVHAGSRVLDWQNDKVFFANAWSNTTGHLRPIIALRRSVLAFRSGQIDEAYQAADEAIIAGGGDAGSLWWRAKLHLANHRPNEAKRDIDALLAEAPTFPGAHAALAYIGMLQAEWSLVEAESKAELRIDPSSELGRALLALALGATSRPAEAMEVLQPLLRSGVSDPSSAGLLQQLHNLLLQQGHTGESAQLRALLHREDSAEQPVE